ncbi:MFS transporter [Roseateles sp.]|uniref:MFS transporter n=1 Tax=Roseateles sp. TaxID=1971397 RepID=UPI002DFBE17A|nr:MFS transporter [Roseateles sp.]HEV6964983.1 MFS transporter [Roseateles sp.]
MTTTTAANTPSTNSPAPAWVLPSLALCMLLPSLAVSSANVALPTLAQAFGEPFAAVQWVVLAFLLATTALIVAAGRLGDLVGRRRLLLAGIALFTLASAACAVAPSLPTLIAARAAQGVGAAAMMALTLAFVGDAVPKAHTGRAMGLLGTMSAVGTALGPSLGGLLIAGLGWRALFAVNLPLGLLALGLAWRVLPAAPTAPRRAGLDLPGAALLALTLAVYALAMTRHLGLLPLAALGLAAFIGVEARAASPLLKLERLRDRALSASLAMNALVSTVMMATLVVGPFHLSRQLGLGAAAVGAWMSVGPLTSALSGMPAGRLVDRFGPQSMARLGLMAVAAGCALIGVLPATLGVLAYVGPLVIVTPGYALFQAANNTAVMAGVAGDERGVIAGLLTLSRNLGLVTGASAMGALFAAAGLSATFAVATGLALFALALAKRAA